MSPMKEPLRAKLRIYLIWLFGGIALFLGLYFGIKNLLEMLRDAM